ncbi:MAG: cytidylate kinase-like family protein [Lachnospiraceae bacterium]|nr:cytidylate kinase-like family protein [Lachnospiraceae bacterium]
MKQNTIVTINREFGCGARKIARTLAEELNVHFYDRELIDMAAERAGLNKEMLYSMDENMNGKGLGSLVSRFGYGTSTNFYSDKAIEAQEEVIREIASKDDPCVIFGRCSDYYLQEYPDVVSIFLYAPLNWRVTHLAQTQNISEEESSKLIKRVDRQRHDYYKYVTGEDRGGRYDKYLMIDVSKFGEEGSIKLMKYALDCLEEV